MDENESSGGFITQLNKYDVLCGRGSGPNERMGNINFRDLVSTRKNEYLAIKPRDHKNKNRIAREVVAIVRSRGGRFLKRAAGVETGDDDTEAYELADETTVLEKAKQALRQNRSGGGRADPYADVAGIYGGNQSGRVDGVTHMPPQPNPYEAFAARLQQASYAAATPAETAIRNLQMHNYAAQQQQQRNDPPQANSMLEHNPYFATARSGSDLDLYRNAIAIQQYKYMQQTSIPNNTMAGHPNDVLSPSTNVESEYMRFYLDQQLNQNLRNVSRHGLNAAVLPQKRAPSEIPLQSINARCRNSVSDSQIKALENIFAGGSQNQPDVRSADSDQQKRNSSESLIEGLEDMSLPSMSIGEISDFSAQGASQTRSKRSVGGMVVAESTAEQDGSTEDSGEDRAAAKPREIRGRRVSSLGSESGGAMPPGASVGGHGRRTAPRPTNGAILDRGMAPPPAEDAARRDGGGRQSRVELAGALPSAPQKKQRQSLSAYYREMKAAHSGGGLTTERLDAMALDPR